MSDTATPYLYLLMRNDLHSMNPGKACAHSAHAANLFTYDMPKWFRQTSSTPVIQNYWHWVKSANGFGTTITKTGTLKEIQTAVAIVQSLGHPAALVVDPSYPYVLHREYADLIVHPEEYPPVPIGDGMMRCFRSEVTAAYAFGFRDHLWPALGFLPLMD